MNSEPHSGTIAIGIDCVFYQGFTPPPISLLLFIMFFISKIDIINQTNFSATSQTNGIYFFLLKTNPLANLFLFYEIGSLIFSVSTFVFLV